MRADIRLRRHLYDPIKSMMGGCAYTMRITITHFLKALGIALVFILAGILSHLPWQNEFLQTFCKLTGNVLMLALLIAFFDVIFTALPNRKLSFRGQLPGAVICGVAWYVFSFGLSVYVDYFNGFSMYGSLTTIALIMLWLYFCMYIMMMSAEVNVVFNAYFRKWWKRFKTSRNKKA